MPTAKLLASMSPEITTPVAYSFPAEVTLNGAVDELCDPIHILCVSVELNLTIDGRVPVTSPRVMFPLLSNMVPFFEIVPVVCALPLIVHPPIYP